ncbi:hypothetical protein [Pseudomonas turukhanskensis]|uniref:O-antigen ligase domain-containing protein n=1 Tax=Pseudomonas turukhanskensis TaxID=1806536 RepID=A0A9W6K228_9PSED|nr:hypothetical protein [Pseudomonas turukhanskensis]GLK88110.1 hypothetical protein GCM10017655_11720 [Pseudomonas turukhanskensis]
MEAIPIAIFWGFVVLSMFRKPHALLYLFFGSFSFGAFAVIPANMTGGLTLTPTPIVVLLIVARTLCNRAGLEFFVGSALSPKRLLLLFLYWLVALFVTAFMPRLFMNEVTIIPVRLELSTFGEALKPTTQNFSQMAYLSISVFAVFAFTRMMREPANRQHALAAMCLGGAIALVTGVLDFMSQYVPLDPLLAPFRTATYALMTEVEILGGKRVVGLMPEASAYGFLSITFLGLIYFFRHAMESRWLRERVAPALTVGLIGMIWLSTSSASYVGLVVFFLSAGLEWAVRKSSKNPGKGLGAEFWIVWTALVGIGLVVLFAPAVLDPIVAQFNEMVVNKSKTSSYEERTMWTAVGWQALWDTWGLGVGIGATRTSNFAAAVFSNSGIIGGLLYFAFVWQSMRRKLPPLGDASGRAMMNAVRYAYIPTFIVSLLIGTTPDFNNYNAFLYATTLAVVLSTRKQLADRTSPNLFPGHPHSIHQGTELPRW